MDPKEKPANPDAGIPPPPRVFASERHRHRHDRQGEDMHPEPIHRKGRKTLAKIYDP